MSMLLVLFFGLVFGFFDILVFLFLMAVATLIFLVNMKPIWFGGVVLCDSVSYFFVFLTLLLMIFCVFSSFIEYWNKIEFTSFFVCLFLIFFVLLTSFLTMSAIIFYMCFELIFIFMFIFVMSWGYSPERVQASFYMIFYTIVVSLPFLFYMIFFESFSMSLKFPFILDFTSFWGFFFVLVFLVKLPVYMLHLWLPKAHVEAPVSGSMVLAGVLLKLGGYGFFRFTFFINSKMINYSGYMISMGLVGGVISCYLCLRQPDLKSFVAYSSICHMGLGLTGIFSLSKYGHTGGLFMMIAHGFCSSCLFLILYLFYERLKTRSLMVLKGMGVIYSFMMLIWFIFSILNMGVPPSFSFFSEIFIVAGTLNYSLMNFLFLSAVLFFSGVYGIFLYTIVSHGKPLTESMVYLISMRELLNVFGHVYYLFFIILFLLSFF